MTGAEHIKYRQVSLELYQNEEVMQEIVNTVLASPEAARAIITSFANPNTAGEIIQEEAFKALGDHVDNEINQRATEAFERRQIDLRI